MKLSHYLVLGWVALASLTACKHEVLPVEPIEPPGTQQPGEPGAGTEAGQPQGAVISQTIGPAGGTISAEDGRFSVTIPAGALTSDVTIGLQPLSNTNNAGKGTAYRMTPHGQQFSQPVTLTIHYTEEELEGTMPEALGIAYQNDKGVWMAVGGTKLDTAQRSLSIRTKHFSDWSFFEFIHMEPLAKAISPGEKVALSVRSYFGQDVTDIMLPLTPEDREIALQQAPNLLLDAKFVDQWQLIGEGSLQTGTNTAEYQSPAKIPARNPVEVSVRVKSGGKAIGILISRIYVVPPGLSIQVGGGEWRTFTVAGMNGEDGLNVILAQDGSDWVNVVWHGAPYGQLKWTLKTVTCDYLRSGGKELYQHVYGNDLTISGGGLTVVDASSFAGQKMVVGFFDIKPAGYLDTRIVDHPIYTTAQVRGVFRVKQM